MTPEQDEAAEASLRRSMAEPMPPELRTLVEDLIEPHTMQREIDHGDVMTCVRVAYPVIRDWLRDHPGFLRAGAP